MKRKYTKEFLEPLVKSSVSFAEVIRKSGVRWTGGVQNLIVQRIKEYELDFSHFTGQGTNRGKSHKGGPHKRHWSKILVNRTSGYREKSVVLKRALIESGVDYSCTGCKLNGLWNNKELVLQIDHKDGNYLNDSKDNLRFLCPNCHSQTPTYSRPKSILL